MDAPLQKIWGDEMARANLESCKTVDNQGHQYSLPIAKA
jgi:hypothetical protein